MCQMMSPAMCQMMSPLDGTLIGSLHRLSSHYLSGQTNPTAGTFM